LKQIKTRTGTGHASVEISRSKRITGYIAKPTPKKMTEILANDGPNRQHKSEVTQRNSKTRSRRQFKNPYEVGGDPNGEATGGEGAR
jgi:hypothetical protein